MSFRMFIDMISYEMKLKIKLFIRSKRKVLFWLIKIYEVNDGNLSEDASVFNTI